MIITDALREEHKAFNVIFDEIFGDLDQLISRRQDLVQIHAKASLLAKALSSHVNFENDILFPAVSRALGAMGAAATIKTEHEEIEGVLLEIFDSRLAAAEIEDPEKVRDALTGVIQLARQHFVKEEEVVYPIVEATLEESQQRAFGLLSLESRRASQLSDRKRTVSPPPHRQRYSAYKIGRLGPHP